MFVQYHLGMSVFGISDYVDVPAQEVMCISNRGNTKNVILMSSNSQEVV